MAENCKFFKVEFAKILDFLRGLKTSSVTLKDISNDCKSKLGAYNSLLLDF